MAQEEELDLKGLFYKLANAEQEGEDAVMDRTKITRALKVPIDSVIKHLISNYKPIIQRVQLGTS